MKASEKKDPILHDVLDEAGFTHQLTSDRKWLGRHDIMRKDTGEVVFTGTCHEAWQWYNENYRGKVQVDA